MKNYYLPSGLNTGLDFLIDKNWTPEQALAVFENCLTIYGSESLITTKYPSKSCSKKSEGRLENLRKLYKIDNMDF
jgi:hypothetical protein